MEQEAAENREPEKPDVCELGLRLRWPPGSGEEEPGEVLARAPPGWQPEEEVEPLPPSSLEPRSGVGAEARVSSGWCVCPLAVWHLTGPSPSACPAASMASSRCRSRSRSSSSRFCCFLLRLIFFRLFFDSFPVCHQSLGHS